MARPFRGTINLDIRKSKPDWDAFLDPRAPKDAPNVLVILYDDTGHAAWSPYGGRIEMPTLDRLAKNGLTYTQWHTTSVCSPTRSTFLTDRNHHANGFGTIAESAVGFPGYAGHIPLESANIGQVLRDAGWSTFWIGKNHNVPVDAFDMGSSKKRWPLGLGFDRFYGFIGGETNQWFPELIEDNHFVQQPYTPVEGYHFSRDIADKAIALIRDSKQSKPEKPWYLWYNPGANHAPHHAPREYIEKYKGKFDLVRPWDTLSADEKRLFARMAEVYAALSEFTDVQVGRLIDYLEESGQLDNTLILYCADNGASGEGSPSGWAVAFSTPYRMFKRYANYAGGTCDQLVVHWPRGIKAKGELRHQYHHCIDIVPTILECCGVRMPEMVDGVKQSPLAGVSMRYSFDDANAPTRKETQYYEMIGTRGLWHKGWKVATEHGPLTDVGHFDTEPWQLFHVDEDRAESNDVAAQNVAKVKELAELWMAEARRNDVLPVNDLPVVGFHELEFKVKPPATGHYEYYPGTTEIPEATAARTLGVSFKLLAEVEFTPESEGVICAQGSRFGGYTMFVKDHRLNYVYNFLGIEEQKLSCEAPTAGTHIVGVDFAKQKLGEHHEMLGHMKLYVDERVGDEKDIRTQSGHYALAGEGLCIGYDSGDTVSREYHDKFAFNGGGRIRKVVYDVADDVYLDIERQFAAALARD